MLSDRRSERYSSAYAFRPGTTEARIRMKLSPIPPKKGLLHIWSCTLWCVRSAWRVLATKICEIVDILPGFPDVISKENALTFVQNEKTIDLPDILAQCLVIVAPTSGIIGIVISREGFFWITMDFRGPRKRRFVMGKRGVSKDPDGTPLFRASATVEPSGPTLGHRSRPPAPGR